MSLKNNFSLEEKFKELNKILLLYAIKRLKIPPEVAKDLLQNVWVSVFKRIEENQELQNKFKNTPEYFKSYMYKSVYNAAKNYYKSENRKNQIFKPYPESSSNPENNQNVNRNEISKEFKSKDPQPDDILLNKQWDKIMKEYINKLKEELKDEEIELIDALLEQLKEEGVINTSKVGRHMGIGSDKAHNILNRIKRRIQKFDKTKKGLREVSASIAALDFGFYDLFRDILVPEEFDEEISAAGEEISKKILNQLSLDDFTRLSQILK